MFTYQRTIYLKDTDATGVLFFANQLEIALEAFEECLMQKGSSLRKMLEKGEFLMPIVRVESDYKAPLRVGDVIEVTAKVKQIGTSSFTLTYSFYDPKRALEVGNALITHVAQSKETLKAMPMPQEILTILTFLK